MFYRNRTLGFNYRVALWFNSKGINYESQSDQPPEEDLHYCSPGKISVLPHAVSNTPHLGSLPEADVDAYGGSVPGRVALSRPLLFHKDTVTPLISFSAKSLLYQQPHCTALSPLLTVLPCVETNHDRELYIIILRESWISDLEWTILVPGWGGDGG